MTAFIFDMDGTVVDNMACHNQVWIEYLTELGGSPDPATFYQKSAGKTNSEILRMYLGQDLSDASAARYSEEKEIRYRARYKDAILPVNGVEAFLHAAKRAGVRLALATSAGRKNIAFVLDGLQLNGVFDAIVSAEDVTRGKPDPQGFLLAAQRVGVEPAECTVFEDSHKGIEAGRRAGMAVIAILSGMDAEEANGLPGVTRSARDFTQILDLIPAPAR
ncbi:MAG TPA: HAD family phosphatase [Anaerolineaceae bacterium]